MEKLLAGLVVADENAFNRAPKSALLLRRLARMYRLWLGRRNFLAQRSLHVHCKLRRIHVPAELPLRRHARHAHQHCRIGRRLRGPQGRRRHRHHERLRHYGVLGQSDIWNWRLDIIRRRRHGMHFVRVREHADLHSIPWRHRLGDRSVRWSDIWLR
jgi:hypothetical protein